MPVFDWQFLPSPVLGCLLGSLAWFHNWAFIEHGWKSEWLPSDNVEWRVQGNNKGTTWEWTHDSRGSNYCLHCSQSQVKQRRDCRGKHLPTHFEWSIRLPKGNLPHGQTIWETISQFLHRLYVSLPHEPASHSDHLPRKQENMSTQRLAHTQSYNITNNSRSGKSSHVLRFRNE